MNSLKINPKLINKEEIARKVGFSGDYVRKLLNGERKNKRALEKVHKEILRQLRAA